MQPIKKLVVHILNWRTYAYLRRNKVQLIGVVGSIGKTSVTHAVREVISAGYSVHIPKTNYNTDKSIHLQIFDELFASSTVAWAKQVVKMIAKSYRRCSYNYMVLELGTDHPGELAGFRWLNIKTLIITAITPEHMANFSGLDEVAAEETELIDLADVVYVNASTTRSEHLQLIHSKAVRVVEYGEGTQNFADNITYSGKGMTAEVILTGEKLVLSGLKVFGRHSLDAFVVASLVGKLVGVDDEHITQALINIEPVAGRMQLLLGVKGSRIIDDSYNASPTACIAALETLYAQDVPNRIAVLGQMNEMGEHSEDYHKEVGRACKAGSLDLLITLGKEANDWLAPVAIESGVRVVTALSPYEVGKLLVEEVTEGSAVLVKGSQNKVFAEEAIKAILASRKDISKLTRQSDYWMGIKKEQFADYVDYK